jgi:hypothetical protein
MANTEEFKEFCDDILINTGNEEDILKLSIIYEEYKQWYRNTHGSLKNKKKMAELMKYLDSKYERHDEWTLPVYVALYYIGVKRKENLDL